MVDISQVYSGGNYLKAEDLHGREATVTIASAEVVKLDDGMKVCLYFQGKEKGLLLNKTNSTTIAALYGSQTDHWIGKPITIGMSWVDYQGKQVQAIRVRTIRPLGNGPADHQAPPQHAAQPPARQAEPNAYSQARPDLDDEIPF